MALLFDLDDAKEAQRLFDESAARQAFDRALGHVRKLDSKPGLRLLAEFRSQIAVVEAEVLAEHVMSDGDTRRAERLLDDGKTSKREQRKKAKRAKTVDKNKALADKLGSGAMSEEQVDVIADAADKTNGAAAVDAELIDKVAAVPPEQGKTIADDYVAASKTADGVQSEHDRQRALRRASKFHSKKHGLDVTSIQGDGVAVKAMWDAIKKRADEIYRRDGGRDLPHSAHPRTNDQRRFDAAYELICGKTLHPNGTTTPAASGKKPSSSARPQIVACLTIDKLLGLAPGEIAIQHGLGLIADSVLADYAADADIIAALFDHNGEPLWLHRLERYATSTQFIALILRDGGCVLCGADHSQCQAHHTMPYNAPGKGKTNLNELVLLCQRCHHQLHNNNETIYQDHTRTWRTRPATPNETPPPKPTTTRNQIRRE